MRYWRMLVAVYGVMSLAVGCRQMPTTANDELRPAGVDQVMDLTETGEEPVPIEKEMAAPKGFFGRKESRNGGWSSESRAIEQSLGVNR
ncbi:MAG: hypothetical protein ACKO0V_21615 [bacterium]